MFNIILASFIFFNVTYVISKMRDDFSTIDIAWGPSFLLIFIVAAFNNQDLLSTRVILIGILTFIWSMRLAGYILYRSIKKGEEDYRYKEWREDWGKNANIMFYFKVFMLQMILSLIMGSPLFLIFLFNNGSSELNIFDYIGIIFWLIGFLFESIGDYQKNKFKKNLENKMKPCDVGLWKYTRHPNYFGEALLWWGIFLMTISVTPFYYTIWAPLILNYFLINVSGVAMLEKSYVGRAEYEQYMSKTSRFIPMLPKEIL